MTDPFWKNFRRQSHKADWWQYDQPTNYFVTICTKDRGHYFCDIRKGKMEFSKAGVLANVIWQELPRFAKNVEIGPFVIMPNHLHGIIRLKTPSQERPAKQESHIDNIKMSEISPTTGSLPVAIRLFKGTVTRHARRLWIPLAWQGRYHDRIIRDSNEYAKLSQYIKENPVKWDQDELNTK